MTLLSQSRRAATGAPILDVLAERWSPRSYDARAVVPEEQIASLIEAARWAPSAMNAQPWRLIVARRGSATFDRVAEALVTGNRSWASQASLLVVSLTLPTAEDGTVRRWAEYDTGQAVSQLSVQAHALGLHVHTMGGFDAEALRTSFDLGPELQPQTVVAIGRLADAELLPERLRERERAERTRLPVTELVVIDD